MTELTVHPELATHTEKMSKNIYKISDNVYHTLGYGLANVTMVIGYHGVIIIYTMEDVDSAREILAEFRKFTDKPVKAILYTHNHIDHIGGVKAFTSDEDVRSRRVTIYAHEKLLENVINFSSTIGPIINRRSSYFAGSYLEKGSEGFVNLGIGPFIGTGLRTFIVPNKTFGVRNRIKL